MSEGQDDRTMIVLDRGNVRFTYRVAGICLHESCVLLNQLIGTDSWFLPGGRAELMETAEESLCREMQEELGADVNVGRLVWVIENFYQGATRLQHEIGLYFLAALPPDSAPLAAAGPFPGCEEANDLTFQWFALDALADVILNPAFLRQALRSIPSGTEHIIFRSPDYDEKRRDAEMQR